MIKFMQPNLAPTGLKASDLDKINFPTWASEKLDGVRCLIIDGKAYSRKGLPLHDVFHKRFKPFLDLTLGSNHVFDCEVFNPDATFQQITSSLANEDGVPIKLYVFDYMTLEEWNGVSVTPFRQRLVNLRNVLTQMTRDTDAMSENYIEEVPQVSCSNKDEVMYHFNHICDAGGEGLMLRHPDQLYKHGRSTLKEAPVKGGGFYKLKLFETLDAVIVGFEAKNRLTEEAKESITDKDAFGRSKRGHRKDDRVAVDEIGAVTLQIPDKFYKDAKGNDQPVIFNATWAKGSPVREEMTWDNREQFIGRWVEVEYMSVGMKDLPRLGRITRFRCDLD